jgi:predicted dehydrogenase
MTGLGFALLGYGFMGKAHSRALREVGSLEADPAALPALVSICGRDRQAVERARAEYGWRRAMTDWRDQVADPEVTVFDNAGPNALHLEPSLAAIGNGKHVFCEKPLAGTAPEAHRLWRKAEEADAVHMCGFNYRFFPAVRLARELLESGELGEPTHFRARFLASSALRRDQRRTWRFQRSAAGSGALADIGSHIIDLARYLVGDPVSVSATTKTYVPEREGGPVDVDDAFAAVIEFDGGAIGALEASRVAGRRSNVCVFEVDAVGGSVSFDVERLNELEVITTRKEPRRIEVTDPSHPFMHLWWPAPGHGIGWGSSFTHEMRHYLRAVVGSGGVRPHGADFEDGYRCAEVCDAILRASESGRREKVAYRPIRSAHGEPGALERVRGPR